VLGSLGMGVASIKLVAQHRTRDPVRAGHALASALMVSLVIRPDAPGGTRRRTPASDDQCVF
jgi:hypothetical protein